MNPYNEAKATIAVAVFLLAVAALLFGAGAHWGRTVECNYGCTLDGHTLGERRDGKCVCLDVTEADR